MKNKLNFFIAFLFLFFTTNSYSNTINEINFIGLNNSSANSLSKELSLKVGDEYSDSSSNLIIQSLFKTELFSDITVLYNEGTLNITLVENPTIKYFEFVLDSGSGFTNWLKGEKMLLPLDLLNEELIAGKLSAGNPFTQTKLDNFIELLKSKYSSSGYYNVNIFTSLSLDAQNRVGVELTINQSERAKIKSFTITGTKNISEDKLLKLFKIGEADMALVNYFTNKDLFTESEFSQGIDLMTNAYFDKGYLDFQILSVDTKLNDKKTKIDISIEISEGIQYQLGEISFGGEYLSLIHISEPTRRS